MTQHDFLTRLERLIEDTQASSPFKGKAKALRALKRVRDLSDLQK